MIIYVDIDTHICVYTKYVIQVVITISPFKCRYFIQHHITMRGVFSYVCVYVCIYTRVYVHIMCIL